MTVGQRWVRAIGYGSIGLGGVASLLFPSFRSEGPMSLTGGPVMFLWAMLLAVGGLTSAVGSAADIWLGEYAGLWPIILTFTIYGLASALSGNLIELALALTILGWSLLLLARWREVAMVRSEALRFHRYQRRLGGHA